MALNSLESLREGLNVMYLYDFHIIVLCMTLLFYVMSSLLVSSVQCTVSSVHIVLVTD